MLSLSDLILLLIAVVFLTAAILFVFFGPDPSETATCNDASGDCNPPGYFPVDPF